MGGTGNAGVIRSHEHFHSMPQAVFSKVHKLGDELLKILLDIGVVLVGRYADIRRDTLPVLVEFIGVKQDASRGFHAAVASAGVSLKSNF